MENKDDIEAKVSKERWAALEANPEVMTKLCHQLGVSPMFEVVDVWGLDPDMLGTMVGCTINSQIFAVFQL